MIKASIRTILVALRRLLPVLLVLGGLFAFYLIFISDAFTIRKIYVFADQEVLSQVEALKIRRNLFFFSVTELKQALKKDNPWVKEINLVRRFPHSLELHITPRISVLAGVSQGNVWLIDGKGRIMSERKGFTGDKFPRMYCRVEAESQQISDPNALFIVELVSSLPTPAGFPLTAVYCEEEETYRLEFESIEALVTDEKSATDVASSLQVLFKQFRIEGRYPRMIDLRFTKPVLVY